MNLRTCFSRRLGDFNVRLAGGSIQKVEEIQRTLRCLISIVKYLSEYEVRPLQYFLRNADDSSFQSRCVCLGS
jgi:hypothetical protein